MRVYTSLLFYASPSPRFSLQGFPVHYIALSLPMLRFRLLWYPQTLNLTPTTG
ncbi:MAG TPA: hypothetical protein VLA19_26845 [Herpetosiphonaceae bacterium]|nr:hypothetical protein [Herpetosiphonaceae bacterium]